MAEKEENIKSVEAEIDSVLADDIDKFEHFAIANWKGILILGVVIVVGISTFAIGLQLEASSDKEVIALLENSKTVEELEMAIPGNISHPAYTPAALRLAKLYLDDKKYTKAIETLNKVISKNINDELKGRLKLNIAYVYEKQNKLQDAIEIFNESAALSGVSSAIRAEGQYSAARNLVKLNKTSDAILILEELNALKEKSFWTGQAKDLLNSIKCKNSQGDK